MQDLTNILNSFSPTTLEEMDEVKLMNRTDTKYILNAELLPAILNEASEFYKILEIEKSRKLKYKTMYYDTSDFKMYTAHQNGKMNRYKVRNREYVVSGINFLEVKFKSNKGRTIKKRIKVDGKRYDKKAFEFIEKRTPFNFDELQPRLWNEFSRLTLVHKLEKERITIDLDLSFINEDNKTLSLPFLSIIEVKKEGFSMSSDIIRILKNNGVREMRVSKYCIGSVLINAGLKYNRFKPKILIINKISNDRELNLIAAVG